MTIPRSRMPQVFPHWLLERRAQRSPANLHEFAGGLIFICGSKKSTSSPTATKSEGKILPFPAVPIGSFVSVPSFGQSAHQTTCHEQAPTNRYLHLFSDSRSNKISLRAILFPYPNTPVGHLSEFAAQKMNETQSRETDRHPMLPRYVDKNRCSRYPASG